jgi:serine/threonine protein kinase
MPNSSTELRTTIGTMDYKAPEVRHYIEVDEEDNDKGHVYTNAVDIWSLGCVIYQIRARQLAFPTSRQFKRYCDGKAPFPTQPLIENTSGSGIEFLKNLLVPIPSLRPTASEALQAGWLCSEDLSDIWPHQRRENALEPHDAAGGTTVLPRA